MRDRPLVSIVVASYNHERFIGQAIESVWRQSYRPIELVVVDDGSNDSSWALLKAMAEHSPIPMRVVAQENRGPGSAFGHGVDLAKGEWLCILASDDFYADDFVERNMNVGTNLEGARWVLHSNAHLVEEDGTLAGTMDAIASRVPLEGEAFELMVTGGGRLLPSTMFVRRDVFLDAGGFDPTMIAEDTDLQLRLARHARFHYIRDPIFYSRYSPGSLGKQPWAWGDSIIRAISKHQDILGSRLPGLLSKASENISSSCFEHGRPSEGLAWARHSLAYAQGPTAKSATAIRLAVRMVRAHARLVALRLFPRERLVRIKRRLAGQEG